MHTHSHSMVSRVQPQRRSRTTSWSFRSDLLACVPGPLLLRPFLARFLFCRLWLRSRSDDHGCACGGTRAPQPCPAWWKAHCVFHGDAAEGLELIERCLCYLQWPFLEATVRTLAQVPAQLPAVLALDGRNALTKDVPQVPPNMGICAGTSPRAQREKKSVLPVPSPTSVPQGGTFVSQADR